MTLVDQHGRVYTKAELDAERAKDAVDYPPAEETCVFCGESYGPHQFEDGLRCKFCAEEQDGG